MNIKQLYTPCLSVATYYISSNGEAAIIDPLRETKPYINLLQSDNTNLKYIFLTHFHADFVSGHVDLAGATGAKIICGPTAMANFNFHQGRDGENFKLGNLNIKLIHTPGHTLESICLLLFDSSGKEHCLFSGDTVFIGDVGRPDLAATDELTKEDLAKLLYRSIHNKIFPLPDTIIIYPNHGKGSECGKHMSEKTFDTLLGQKQTNYALNPKLTEEDFVERVLEGLLAPPQYFPKNVQMNKQINKNINEIISKGLTPLTITQFLRFSSCENILLLDVRSAKEFADGHIPGSIFIGLEGPFAPLVGALIPDLNQKIVLVSPKARELEAITRLSRVGYDNVIGYIEEATKYWTKKGFELECLNSIKASSKILLQKASFIDVRENRKYEDSHAHNSQNIPIKHIINNNLNPNIKYYIYCNKGYHSTIAISVLKKLGITNLVNIIGGFEEMQKSYIPIYHKKCSCAECNCKKLAQLN
jgi:glyoxylase-like metal-dependent hydrolase (beta-lactamase superfamily II)/rhodanese-related sulfurtransferase